MNDKFSHEIPFILAYFIILIEKEADAKAKRLLSNTLKIISSAVQDRERLEKALELLRNAECTGATYVDLAARSEWKKNKHELLATSKL